MKVCPAYPWPEANLAASGPTHEEAGYFPFAFQHFTEAGIQGKAPLQKEAAVSAEGLPVKSGQERQGEIRKISVWFKYLGF